MPAKKTECPRQIQGNEMTASRFTEREYESQDGLRLYYRDYGPRSDTGALPVVCLHGLTRNSRDFAFIAEYLAEYRRVIAPDLRGRGRSEYDADWHNYSPYRYVADLWTLLDELEIGRLIVLGTSLGGLMTAIMASERPEAMLAAVINDIGPEIDPTGIARISADVGTLPVVTTWDEAIEQTRRNYEFALPDLSGEAWRWYAQSTYRQIDDITLDMNFDRNIGVAFRAGVSGLQHDPWALFDALHDMPTLVLRGETSDILAQATVEKMRARYPQLTSATIRNRGHAPLLNEPDSIAAISGFFAAFGPIGD
jgi:pimeloyl-ACP methyl ester carboxylesterase